MLDDGELYVLIGLLRDVERLAPRLDDLMVPSTPASGSNAGKAARVPGPRPPLRVYPLDVKAQLEKFIFSWSGSLSDVLGLSPPVVRTLPVRARWMLSHVETLAAAEWVRLFMDDLWHPVRLLRDLVEPGGSQAPQVTASPEVVLGTIDDVLDVLAARAVFVGRKTVYRWAASGKITSQQEGNHMLVNPVEVELAAKQIKVGRPRKLTHRKARSDWVA